MSAVRVRQTLLLPTQRASWPEGRGKVRTPYLDIPRRWPMETAGAAWDMLPTLRVQAVGDGSPTQDCLYMRW